MKRISLLLVIIMLFNFNCSSIDYANKLKEDIDEFFIKNNIDKVNKEKFIEMFLYVVTSGKIAPGTGSPFEKIAEDIFSNNANNTNELTKQQVKDIINLETIAIMYSNIKDENVENDL